MPRPALALSPLLMTRFLIASTEILWGRRGPSLALGFATHVANCFVGDEHSRKQPLNTARRKRSCQATCVIYIEFDVKQILQGPKVMLIIKTATKKTGRYHRGQCHGSTRKELHQGLAPKEKGDVVGTSEHKECCLPHSGVSTGE